MAQQLLTDEARFWQDTLAKDGPIEVWEIHGERFLFNGNHRYQAAVAAGADIPDVSARPADLAPGAEVMSATNGVTPARDVAPLTPVELEVLRACREATDRQR